MISGQNPLQVSHPPHMTSAWSSALIPFCAYKTDLNISKHPLTLPGMAFPFCSSFLPTMLEGQLCYMLELNRPSKQGRENQLMLVLDSNEDHSLALSHKKLEVELRMDDLSSWSIKLGSAQRDQGISVKTQIGTLSPNNHFGGGICTMTAAKRMSAKHDFLDMLPSERKCDVELYEDCRARRLAEKCNCVPWEVPGFQV